MSRMTLKSKFLLVLVLLMPFFLYGCGEKNGGLEETIQIFEINNTEEIYNYPDSDIVTIRKHYMIINPPEDLHELKTVVEKFLEDSPINKRIVVEENKGTRVEVYFYRESNKLPRNWQPNEEYFDTDRIEHHKHDLIVYVHWSNSHPEKRYYAMRKSSDKGDYGALIEEIDYIDDKIVE